MQTIIDKTACALVIVDNDPEHSAEQAIEQLRLEAPPNLTFISAHEPRAGVANARNCAMEHVKTDLIAFLDDDQSAGDPEWLEKLYRLHKELKAAVTFGPLMTVLPKTVTEHKAYFSKFFGRHDPSPRGFISDYHGGCNTLIDVAQLPKKRPLFDPATNETGGEDDLLFIAIAKLGGRFAWEPDAPVYERVPIRRAHLGYTLRRAVVYGQGPTSNAIRLKQYHKLVFWMAVGMVKFLWHGLRAGFGYTFKLENRADHLDKAIRGLGKVFFWRTFSLYGAPALRDVNSISEDEITVAPDNGQLDRLTP
jgi:glycosyltransferase involved in cell wall biosynthesis